MSVFCIRACKQQKTNEIEKKIEKLINIFNNCKASKVTKCNYNINGIQMLEPNKEKIKNFGIWNYDMY